MPKTIVKAAPDDAAIPVRRQEPDVETIKLDGQWEGWEFTAYANPTWEEFSKLGSERLEPTLDLLTGLIISWNYVDRDGTALPPPREGGWGKVGMRLIRATLLAYISWVKDGTDVPKN